jgi:hypothetical protein
MDRNFVYPGSIPLDTDLLSINRSAMVALGYLAQAALGQGTVADGLACMPTSPASLAVTVGPGSVTQFSVIDAQAYGSLPADPTAPLVKMGINTSATSFTLAAPTTPGQTVAYLIQASLQESDVLPVVLPYYNASDPSQPFSGPANAGTSQNTERIQRAQLELKAGAPASAGAQALPPVDNGWVGLYMVTVSYGQSAVTAANISVLPAAPFIAFKLPSLRPGFASGVQSFYASVPFTVPAGVTQVEVELWGGGSGSFALRPVRERHRRRAGGVVQPGGASERRDARRERRRRRSQRDRIGGPGRTPRDRRHRRSGAARRRPDQRVRGRARRLPRWRRVWRRHAGVRDVQRRAGRKRLRHREVVDEHDRQSG